LFKTLSLRLFAIAAMLIASCLIGNAAFAQSFVRDAEIEALVRDYGTPVFEAAGLNPQAIEIHLIHDNQLNAFVAGGQKIFVYTGLLMEARDPSEVIGVLAHETGHIVGGHLARSRDAIENAQTIGIISSVIGVGAGLLTGRGDVATAAIATGQDAATRSFLSFSRAQESAADQSALRLLEATGQSARGLERFLGVLADQELVSTTYQDPYVRTHPLSRDRIDTIDAFLKSSKYADAITDPALLERHKRMRAKIYAYSYPFKTVLREYPEEDTGMAARYARTFAYYRKHDMTNAVERIDAMIADEPNNPYFYELKAQMLFEAGKPAEAVPYYQKAVDLSPKSGLLLRELGQAQIAVEDPALLPDAQKNLETSVALERYAAGTWRQLAIAYGRQEKMGESAIALAEEAMLLRKFDEAKYQAGKAADMFPVGAPEWLHAQDILNAVEVRKEE